MKNVILIILTIFQTLFLVGCWDSINLEDRAFIIGTAIDIEQFGDQSSDYVITNQLVIPTGLSNPMQDGGENQAFLNITAEGKNIYETNQEIAKRTSKTPFFEHLTLLVISERVAKEENLFVDLIDTYIRDSNMRRSIKVIIARDSAKELLEFTTHEEKLPAMHINDLLEQTTSHLGFLRTYVVGEIEEFHLNNSSFVLPMLTKGDYIEQNMGAVFHGAKQKVIGTLNESELEGLEFIIGPILKKIITVNHHNKAFTFEVDDVIKKIKVDPSNLNDIKVNIELRLTGSMKVATENKSFLNAKSINDIESNISKEITQSMQTTIKKAKEDLNADIFDIWKELENHHYYTWKNLKADWEQGESYFQNTSFDIHVTTDIFSIGTSDRTN